MSRLARFAIIVAAILAVASLNENFPLSAAEELSILIDRVDTEEFPVVKVHLVVINERGLPVAGIAPEAIGVAEDGKAVQKPSLSPLVAAEEPLAVTMVIDTSLSMAGKPLDDAREAASSFIDQIGPNDLVAVIAFAGQVYPIRDFTSSKRSLKSALEYIEAAPNTALYDAIVGSLEVARRAAADRRAIVLLTDGEDTSSTRTLEDTVSAAVGARIPIYAVGLGQNLDRAVLERIATSTGGRSLYAPSSEDLKSTYNALASQLKSRYVLKFNSQLQVDDKQHLMSISVKYQGRKAEKTAQFSTTARPPRIVFLSPRETNLNGKSIPIEVEIESAAPVVRVQFNIDGKMASEVFSKPYRFVWYTDATDPGPHKIRVTARDSVGNSSAAERDISFSVPDVQAGAVPTPEYTRVSIQTPPMQMTSILPSFTPILAVGVLILGFFLIRIRGARERKRWRQRILRLPKTLIRPRCPICAKRYVPQKGCTYCRQREEKTISERLHRIFHDDIDERDRPQ